MAGENRREPLPNILAIFFSNFKKYNAMRLYGKIRKTGGNGLDYTLLPLNNFGDASLGWPDIQAIPVNEDCYKKKLFLF